MQQGVAEQQLEPTIWKVIAGACVQVPNLDSKVFSPTCIDSLPPKRRSRFRQLPPEEPEFISDEKKMIPPVMGLKSNNPMICPCIFTSRSPFFLQIYWEKHLMYPNCHLTVKAVFFPMEASHPSCLVWIFLPEEETDKSVASPNNGRAAGVEIEDEVSRLVK